MSAQDAKALMYDLKNPKPDFSLSSPPSATPNWVIAGPWMLRDVFVEPDDELVPLLTDRADDPVTHQARNLLFDLLCYDGSRDSAFLEVALAFEHTPGFTLST